MPRMHRLALIIHPERATLHAFPRKALASWLASSPSCNTDHKGKGAFVLAWTWKRSEGSAE